MKIGLVMVATEQAVGITTSDQSNKETSKPLV
jgi:hypothetical protein